MLAVDRVAVHEARPVALPFRRVRSRPAGGIAFAMVSVFAPVCLTLSQHNKSG
jgi:hypothetical protein